MNYPVKSEVQYVTEEGSTTHSDLPYRDSTILHAALDEWLTKAHGTGFFYVGNVRDLQNELLRG